MKPFEDIEGIARHFLGFPTLEVENSDSLDWREVSKIGVLRALQAAYELGVERREKKKEADASEQRRQNAEALVSELRAKGYAVQVFSADDLCPSYDYKPSGGAQAWFANNSRHLEDRLAALGNMELDAMAADAKLPGIEE